MKKLCLQPAKKRPRRKRRVRTRAATSGRIPEKIFPEVWNLLVVGLIVPTSLTFCLLRPFNPEAAGDCRVSVRGGSRVF